MKWKPKPDPPFQVEPSSVVESPISWDTFAVWLFCVVERTSDHTTKNAVPPASALLASPARLGKLLQRNCEPPAFRRQSAALGSSAPATGFVAAIWASLFQ